MDNQRLMWKLDPAQKTKELGDLFGIFFEDLNHAADGGLYAEMVRNRSFEFDAVDNPAYHALTAWHKEARGDAVILPHIETANPLNAQNPHYLVVEVTRAGDGGGMTNKGYAGGMWVEKGKQYCFSCSYFRKSTAKAPLRVTLEAENGMVLAGPAAFLPESKDWAQATLILTAEGTGDARLVILSQDVQTFALDMVSLFPAETFHRRENGLRKDIAQILDDMKPKFLRFPGGCLLHCGSLDSKDRCSQYRWKNTLGAVNQRPARRNSWGYNQTLGLGYYEFFCFCEDIGAQPLPVISAGWDPHTLRAAPLEDMQEWIDEALDLVEFACGGADTPWGSVRAQMGHPSPFGLKYLGIGNEEIGDPFFERFHIIHHAVKARYPDLHLIGTAGASCNGEVFEQGWGAARKAGSSYVDEHYYQSPQWFEANMHRYERYPAEGPQAFLGEYASRGETYRNALVEAAYMVGMEKAPGLGLACYAPMLCSAAYVNWKPNMIWFDSHRVYGTPSYQVQKLFMNHQGSREISSALAGGTETAVEPILAKGGLCFHSTSPIEVTGITLTNRSTEETICPDGFTLGSDHEDHPLNVPEWERYALSFTAVRHFEAVSEFPRALEVRFGIRDEANHMKWIIDGWSQVSSMATLTDGEYSDQGMYYAPAPSGKQVNYLLEVDGADVKLNVNGVCHAVLQSMRSALDTLYYAASVEDTTGDVILKAVNLCKESVRVTLDAPTLTGKPAEYWQLASFAPEAANSFHEPDKVQPTHALLARLPSELEIPPESVTVYRVHAMMGSE